METGRKWRSDHVRKLTRRNAAKDTKGEERHWSPALTEYLIQFLAGEYRATLTPDEISRGRDQLSLFELRSGMRPPLKQDQAAVAQ